MPPQEPVHLWTETAPPRPLLWRASSDQPRSTQQQRRRRRRHHHHYQAITSLLALVAVAVATPTPRGQQRGRGGGAGGSTKPRARRRLLSLPAHLGREQQRLVTRHAPGGRRHPARCLRSAEAISKSRVGCREKEKQDVTTIPTVSNTREAGNWVVMASSWTHSMVTTLLCKT